MAVSHKCLNCVVCVTISLAVILGISLFMMPYFILNQIIDHLPEDYKLKPANEKNWANIPGEKDIEMTKRIQFYDIKESDNSSLSSIEVSENGVPISFDKKQTMEGLKYDNEKGILTGNLSIGYSYSKRSSSSDVPKRTFKQISLGTLRALETIEKRNVSDMFPILVTSLIEDCQKNIKLNFYTLYTFYEKEYNYTTVIKMLQDAGITKKSTLNNIWFDLNYGFKTISGLLNWVKVVYIKKNIKSGMGMYLQKYFKISEAQMKKIADKSNFIYTTSEKGNKYMVETLKKDTGRTTQTNFTDFELCAIQWGSKNLTRMLNQPENIGGMRNVNASIPLKFEFASTKKNIVLSYDKIIKDLLDYDKANGREGGSTTSLLNFKNAKYLSENLDHPKKLADYFGLDENHSKQLIKYYKECFESLQVLSKDLDRPDQAYYRARFSRDGIRKALTTLEQYVFDNITMKAFSQVYFERRGTKPCVLYFCSPNNRHCAKDSSIVCQNPRTSLDNYEGITKWVIAFYQKDFAGPENPNGIQMIANDTKLSEEAVTKLLSGADLLKTTLNGIQNNFTQTYKCFRPPCDRRFLAEKQYYESYITKNATYQNMNVWSVAQFSENKPFLGNKIPEIGGFYYLKFNYTEKVFGGEQDAIFSDGIGSVTNYYQVFLLYEFSKDRRASDVAHTFNIWSPTEYFAAYGDHLLLEWYFDGLVKKTKYGDAFEGYYSQCLTRLRNLPSLRGGIPNLDLNINFQFLRNWTAPVEIDSGWKEFSKRGNLLKFNNSEYITDYTGKQAWKKPEKLKGTLTLFTNPIKNNEDIEIYEPEHFRIEKFTFDKLVYEYQFTVNYLKWDNDNYKKSMNTYESSIPGFNNLTKFRNFPWMTSLPNYHSVDTNESLIQNVTFNGKKPEEVFSDNDLPFMKTERFSGMSFGYNKKLLVSLFKNLVLGAS